MYSMVWVFSVFVGIAQLLRQLPISHLLQREVNFRKYWQDRARLDMKTGSLLVGCHFPCCLCSLLPSLLPSKRTATVLLLLPLARQGQSKGQMCPADRKKNPFWDTIFGNPFDPSHRERQRQRQRVQSSCNPSDPRTLSTSLRD